MRNLKKFLALVLAMVMAFSLMLSASATDISKFEDQDKVTDEFVEAVAVLTGLNVIKGDGDEENPSIRPQDEITRAEAAALVYRIVTGDINDTQVGLYADYSNFTDVKPRTATDAGDWFAGYVGYCQNAGIIKGTSPTTFNPYGKVTGYEVLAMILRAAGYGKNNEFTGSQWQVNVASLAKTKHISDSVTSTLYNYTLNMNARREIVAELLFRGSLIPQVTWSSALGYNEFDSVITVTGNKTYNRSLASEVFGLYHEGWKEIDMWGNPGYQWKARRNPTSDPARTVATIEAKPSMEAFTDLKRECDIAHALDFDGEKLFTLYVNGKTALTDSYKIVATDTVTKVGGYGRLVKVYTKEDLAKQSDLHWFYEYWNEGNFWQDGGDERNVVTMVDTMLAKVVAKTDSVLDPAGHVITPAKLTVDVYSYTLNGEGNNSSDRRIISKGATDAANWTQNVGDVILMNAYTNKASKTAVAPNGTDDLANNIVRTGDQTKLEAAAFETNMLVVSKDLVEGKTVKIIDPPTVITGKQTSISWNSGKHTVEGQEKTDALTFDLDEAGTNMNTTYNWYFDQYGYLIGVEETANVRYGVITSVYAALNQGDSDTTGLVKAIASVTYSDGTTGTEEINYFLVHGTDISTKTRGTTIDATMTHTVGNPDTWQNVSQLWPIYDKNGNDPMAEQDLTDSNMANAGLKPLIGVEQGVVHMAPVAASNTYGASKASANNKYGILKNNLFKFVKSTNDTTVAVEVAGGGTTYTGLSLNTSNNLYGGHWAAKTVSTHDGGKLYKSLANINLDVGAGSTPKVAVWLENDTQIIFRDVKTGKIETYTLATLPGDISIPKQDVGPTTAAELDDDTDILANEVDWADTDGDGRAEVVYVTGSMAGQTTYGLVYYNRGYTNWDGTTGTANLWLNGEQTTLSFSSLELLNKVRSAVTSDGKEYAGHLFAVRMFNGVVVDVLEKAKAENGVWSTGPWTHMLLLNENTGWFNKDAETILDGAATHLGVGIFDSKHTAQDFKLSTDNPAGGNPYTSTTKAAYYRDIDKLVSGTVASTVVFVPDVLGGTITVSSDTDGDGAQDGTSVTYYTNPNTKRFGIGAGVTEGDAALAYLNEYSGNDVTIVYDDTSKSVLEIYVAIDPNITPSGDKTVGFTGTGVTTPDTAAKVTAAVESGARDTVIYSNKYAPTGGTATTLGVSDAIADEVIYFPFVADNSTTATLEIRKVSDGSVVYTETSGTLTTDSLNSSDTGNRHAFVVNFAGGANIAGSWGPGLPMVSGTEYSYRITGVLNGIAMTLSQGTFTMK